MKKYRFLVSLCNGWCNGFIEIKENDEDKAHNKAMDLVVDKLVQAFPTLGIDYAVELHDEQELSDDEIVKCKDCGKEMLEEDARYVEFKNGTDYICEECLEKYSYCEACETYYDVIKDNVDVVGLRGGIICPDCYEHGWRYK